MKLQCCYYLLQNMVYILKTCAINSRVNNNMEHSQRVAVIGQTHLMRFSSHSLACRPGTVAFIFVVGQAL